MDALSLSRLATNHSNRRRRDETGCSRTERIQNGIPVAMMNPARSWLTLVFAQPVCAGLVWSLESRPIRLATWCHVGLARLSDLSFTLLVFALAILALSIGLTFVTNALQNARLRAVWRVAWAVALLFAAPVSTFAYWFFQLRAPR